MNNSVISKPRITLPELADRLYGNDPYKKPRVYLDEYERLFAPMRDKPIKFFELGVYKELP